MPVKMALWSVDKKPVRLQPSGMPTEERLEELIEQDPYGRRSDPNLRASGPQPTPSPP